MPFRTVTDQLGETISFSSPPQRIISLVPSLTELLYTLNLDHRVAGITRFCVHPAKWRSAKTIIGGTKNFDFTAIDSIKPDLVIGNKEENYREGIIELKRKYPVWMSDIGNLDEAINMIRCIGDMTGTQTGADHLADSITTSFQGLQKSRGKRVLYLIWRKPWMAAGRDTFIDDMLARNGYINVAEQSRYPVLSAEDIGRLNPDYIFLSSEPYPFSEKHFSEFETIAPASAPVLVDGEMFSWYGSRLQYSCEYFHSLPGKD